jgi:hypothetical protein
MKKIDLGQTISIFANVGVIAGLIFVGVQLAQDRRIAEQDTLFNAVDSRMYWAELVRDSEGVWIKGLAAEPLTAVEAKEFEALATAWELSHYTYFRGQQLAQLEPSRFVREWALELNTHPGLMRWWQGYRKKFLYTQAAAPGENTWFAAIDEEMERLEANPPQID